MKFLVTGSAGLVGSQVVKDLTKSIDQTYSGYHKSNPEFGIPTPMDLGNFEDITRITQKIKPDVIIHLAAITDVDLCEKEKEFALKINATATETLSKEAARQRAFFVYVSTDYVFDGTKDVYREDDEPHPLGWYAVTKYEGERRVGTLGPFGLTIRIANPYKRRDLKKLDFVHKIVDRLKNGQSVRAPRDQIFVPTLVDDVARAIDVLVGRSASGVYHVVGSQALSPYDAARRIATTYGFDASRIMPTTFDEYFRGMAPRPFHGRLINDKIARFGVKMSTFDEGLRRIYEEDSVGESL